MASPKKITQVWYCEKVWYCGKHKALGTKDNCFEELILNSEGWLSGTCEMVPMLLIPDGLTVLRDGAGGIVWEAEFRG